ncbi:hypothetical protein FT663_01820 [Candidozyma haemuli var. vulneris]|uniref:Uncharacterized protein n=1 Tax=Candidozyma haemuli TaxID=45357 RepID=A0A2V1AZ79_9ASCO|nr:hypothetical protein CXQ85_002841 [[Candida] haemuloni]KAF3991058.1 hypothetical protein FT662_01886 [[Candida] haemuloni var. vulneris]KAF3993652.1 hypothetical protein FT663_01820 [[Candida] haemuloni var. vulneris]PVH23114.1 hypothetical protein CXQ85_002841 [[Candida] haemuloni]
MKFNFDKSGWNSASRLLSPYLFVFLTLSLLSVVQMCLPLINCEFGPIDVPRYLLNASGTNSSSTEFSNLISDIYYQHLDQYLEDNSRFIFLVPSLKVSYSSATLVYEHGVSQNANTLKSIGGNTFTTTRGVLSDISNPLIEFKRGQPFNANITWLIENGIDVFNYEKPPLALITKLIVHKGLRFGYLLSSCLALAALLTHIYMGIPATKYALSGFLSSTAVLLCALIVSECVIHATAKSALLPYIVIHFVHVFYIVGVIASLYWDEDVAEKAPGGTTETEGAGQRSASSSEISGIEIKRDSPRAVGNESISSSKQVPEIKMINSSSSEEKNMEEHPLVPRARRFAISVDQSQGQGSIHSMFENKKSSSENSAVLVNIDEEDASSSKYSATADEVSLHDNSPLLKYKSLTHSKSPQKEPAKSPSISPKQPNSGTDESSFNFGPKPSPRGSQRSKVYVNNSSGESSNHEERVKNSNPKSIPTEMSSFEMSDTPKRSRSLFKESMEEES